MNPASLKKMMEEDKSASEWFDALRQLIRFLRSPEGCPWDREQSALNFSRFFIEEGEELVEALSSGDNGHAEEEYGDCMFSLLSCMAAAEEEGRFSMENALKAAFEKMIRRHEHVFSEDRATNADEALTAWEKVKERERAEQNNTNQPKETES